MKELIIKTYEDNKKFRLNTDIKRSLLQNIKKFYVTANPETYMYSTKDKEYKHILEDKETILIPESTGSVYAIKKILGKVIKKTPGIELFVSILEECNKQSKSLFLYGAKEEVSIKMEEYIKENYKNIKLLGRENGYIKDSKLLEKKIISLKPDVLAVALGIPKQEEFIYRVYSKSRKGIMIGVGGSFDVLSGSVKRAPSIFRKLNIEWLYRIAKEPKRIKRFYNNNIKFVLALNKENKQK